MIVCTDCGVAIPFGNEWVKGDKDKYSKIHLQWHKEQRASLAGLFKHLSNEILEVEFNTIDYLNDSYKRFSDLIDGVNTETAKVVEADTKETE